MPAGLNHLTLAVANLHRSIHFYTDFLGFEPQVRWDSGAYLSQRELWLCLTLDEPLPARDYTHFALSASIDEIHALREQLQPAGISEWKQNHSEGESLYILDPDGHQLELHAGDLATRLESLRRCPYPGLVWMTR